MASTLGLEGIEAIVFRTIGDRQSLWESLLPPKVRRLPEELARVDVPLDDPAFFAPFVPQFHPLIGRPSTPMELYLRLMFLKFRYRLGYESLCAEVTDSISWRRFCRIPLDGAVPHPTTLMKLTTPLRRGRGGRAERGAAGQGCGRPTKTRQAVEHRPSFRRTVKWRTRYEGRISTLKRNYGWDRTRIDSTEGARSWAGHGVLAHNLVKISALAG